MICAETKSPVTGLSGIRSVLWPVLRHILKT
jgi:hypothetical protein